MLPEISQHTSASLEIYAPPSIVGIGRTSKMTGATPSDTSFSIMSKQHGNEVQIMLMDRTMKQNGATSETPSYNGTDIHTAKHQKSRRGGFTTTAPQGFQNNTSA